MLIKINQVAKELNVSLRTVQLWCKADGIKKIGNEYQLTKEIVERWEVERTKTKTKTTNENVTPTKRKKDTSFSTFKIEFIIAFLVIFLLATLITTFTVIYYRMDNEIIEAKTTIKINEIIKTKTDKQIEVLNKKLIDANDIIQAQDKEIYTLKSKDSLRIFKRY